MYQNIIFVTEDEAKSYMLPPNTKILLMDKYQPIFYIKTTDSLGYTAAFESYSFAPISAQTQQQAITKSDLDALKEEILAIVNTQSHKEDAFNDNKQSVVQPTATTNSDW